VNFEDPEVLQRLVGPDMKKYWKETYGFDWVHQGDLVGRFKSDF
jgi:hypothetical protein